MALKKYDLVIYVSEFVADTMPPWDKDGIGVAEIRKQTEQMLDHDPNGLADSIFALAEGNGDRVKAQAFDLLNIIAHRLWEE